jgi:hypothetical protein
MTKVVNSLTDFGSDDFILEQEKERVDKQLPHFRRVNALDSFFVSRATQPKSQ